MAKLIVLGGLIYGGYWLYKYMLAHPNIDKGNVIKTVGVIIVGLIALTKKNNTNSPKIMRTYRCRGCGREISTSFNPSESPKGRDRCHTGYRHYYFFGFQNGQPKVYLTQQNQGNDKNYMYFNETQNQQLKQVFIDIVNVQTPQTPVVE